MQTLYAFYCIAIITSHYYCDCLASSQSLVRTWHQRDLHHCFAAARLAAGGNHWAPAAKLLGGLCWHHHEGSQGKWCHHSGAIQSRICTHCADHARVVEEICWSLSSVSWPDQFRFTSVNALFWLRGHIICSSCWGCWKLLWPSRLLFMFMCWYVDDVMMEFYSHWYHWWRPRLLITMPNMTVLADGCHYIIDRSLLRECLNQVTLC